ncbi:BPTD_3080 family restriction endonuclease [Microbacterium sp.]|uniref:BPTD_3080 family restriction endonuclease n=1 Tax=Microbacterium sp. TaxID=51671 RepID=UPI0028114ABA|nr:DEAD/DEAH box helicase family protein [Microbacterium sp.]
MPESPADALLNPILNGPYDPPEQHFALGPDGPTGEIVPGRRPSESFIPIPQERKGRGRAAETQLELNLDMTGERREANSTINGLRRDVELWRGRGYDGVTPITRNLLLHWADPERENRTLFCQREAAETAIFLTEVSGRRGYTDWRPTLRAANDEHNSGLPRIAMKMATGTGKTVLMAMLIAWQTLNKLHAPRDVRFTSKFLLVAPGITIRDRLRVLLPNEDDNYYDERELVPSDLRGRLNEARIVIANYHQFLPRLRKEFDGVSKATRNLLSPGDPDRYQESPPEIVSRVLRDLGAAPGEIVVLNDEAHHCYQSRPMQTVKLSREDDERNRDARVWFRGLQAIAQTKGFGVKQILDVSATPFYLGGSGWNEGYIFPWTVSDFSLMDAIESGIVKIPRLPVDDDAEGEDTTYRNLWTYVGKSLPKRASSATITSDGWLPPAELEAALQSLYRSYEKEFSHWETHLRDHGEPPPVMIVVCNNTVVSRLVAEWISGHEVEIGGETVLRPGKFSLFDNVENGEWRGRPRTLLIDSAALESGEPLPKDFLQAAAPEIEKFKEDWRRRHPGADSDSLTDQDLLREVMNTVGKRRMLGEPIRCVVSVGMLTEGWDANTVTHILGVRAFSSQLLCEQVIGRGLRRRSWALNEQGRFEPEYANVYGIPFAFIPGERSATDPLPAPPAIEVGSVPGREHLRIEFPRLVGYRIEMPDEELIYDPSGADPFRVGPDTVPTRTEVAGVVGETETDQFQVGDRRRARVAFTLADRLMRSKYTQEGAEPRPWLFPRLLEITKTWLDDHVEYADGYEPWHLLRSTIGLQRAADAIHGGIAFVNFRPESLQPILDRSAPVGDTSGIRFVTRKRVYETTKSEVSHVTLDGKDGNTWENLLAYECELNPNVMSYVKNDRLGFDVPYTYEGRTHRYVPDFLLRLVPHPEDPDHLERTLIVEVSGGQKRSHSPGSTHLKAMTAKNTWCTAVNNHGGFGRWGYIEISTMFDLKQTLQQAIDSLYDDDAIIGDYERLSFTPARRVRFTEDAHGS